MSASSADPPAISIRRAVATDAAAVRDLTRRAYAKWIPLIGREATPATENYDQIVRRDPVDLLLADGELVALVWMVPHPDHLVIENLAVAPAHQGQGLGRRMLAHAEALAARQGLSEVRLYIPTGNSPRTSSSTAAMATASTARSPSGAASRCT
jgi:ribosomal protein S18 acetylase RimI-like enzyme